jgi:hypothetical protein
LTGILRHYATTLLATAPKKLGLPALREQRSLMRGISLRSNFYQLRAESFISRRDYLVQGYKDGLFLKDPGNKDQPAANPMSDPAAMEGMMGMMKGNMMMMVPQQLIMSWINAFFAGFVISMSATRRWRLKDVLMLAYSETPVSPYYPLQDHVTVRRRHPRFRRAVGIVTVMVLSQFIRAAICLHLYSRKRQR